MIDNIQDTALLNNGVKMPWLGLGVFKVEDGLDVTNAVKLAIEAGYRSIDTAAVYGNEKGVRRGIQESGIARKELFITTKVWNSDQGYESTLKAYEESRKKLGLEYIDLYLIHWPVQGKFKETWRALEKLYEDGFARAIGVSNFQIRHLEDLMMNCNVVPMVNQVEFHPLLTQVSLHSFCKNRGILLEAWSPLMRGNLDISILKKLGDKYKKTAAQIVLRWDLQRGVVTIPKSVNPHRIKENADIFDFILLDEEIKRINSLNQNMRFGKNPDHLDNES